jgi:precorrin-2 dehydrogenase/sirohydrochlorin ferrochelatase
MNYYPAFLNLKGKKAVVVGGGRIAERKVLSLIKAGADVTVVSPQLTERLRKEKEAKRIRHRARRYRPGDLKDSFLVIAATDSPEVNSKVAGGAPALLNVVDVPQECNFIAPSVVKRGPLVFAISTGGTSPAFAKAIRKEIEKSSQEVFRLPRICKDPQTRVMREIGDKAREQFLKALLPGHTDMLRTKAGCVKQSVMARFRNWRKTR